MTVNELHKITTALIDKGNGGIDVAIDFSTFQESDNGNILMVESTVEKPVQGADDSGPVGDEFDMLILRGGIEWHAHGDPI